uniref:Ras association domain-containing protein 6 n=1 Tax=Callorhinchus milii TaxID=7868 RepID=V9KXF1_CALMI
MNTSRQQPSVQIGENKYISRAEFSSLLKTYNCFYEDKKNLELKVHEDKGKIVIEGLLDISWGIHQPIRLQIDDEKLSASPSPLQPPTEPFNKASGMTRWGEFDDLCKIVEQEEEHEPLETEKIQDMVYESSTLKPKRYREPENFNLIRSMSEVALVKMRVKSQAKLAAQKAQRHRFSINGHFYNYKTAVFTPTYGSVTNVRINSTMTTQEVIEQLLQKFKIENDPNEFALYVVHATEEKKRLNDTAFPLWERLLHGPSGKIVKIFLMDKGAEEISNAVAQYIKFEPPLLEVILQKLNEEEDKYISNIVFKYKREKRFLVQQLRTRLMVRAETSV